MRRYETIFIIRPCTWASHKIKDIIKRFEGLASTGGAEVIETEEWGFRELAYRIKGRAARLLRPARLRLRCGDDERG